MSQFDERFYFEVPEYADRRELWNFFLGHHIADEPIHKSMGVAEGTGIVDRWLRKLCFQESIDEPLRNSPGRSIVVRNWEKHDLVGLVISEMYKREESRLLKPPPAFPWKMPSSILPAKIRKCVKFDQLMAEILEGTPEKAIRMFDGCDRLYWISSITVHRDFRGQGLGKQLVTMAVQDSKSQRCNYVGTSASSLATQKIADGLGFAVLKEIAYNDVRVDKNGQAFLDNTDGHKSIKVVALRNY